MTHDELTRLRAENARLRALAPKPPIERVGPNGDRPRSGPLAGALIRQAIVDYLRTGAHTVPEIMAALQIAERTVWRHLTALLRSREVRRTVVVGRDLPHVFSHRDLDETRSLPAAPVASPPRSP